MSRSAGGRVNRHCGDMQFIRHQPATGQAQQLLTVAEAETETAGLLKLTAPLLRRPETVQGTLIQPETGRQPGAVEIEHDHGESESPASGSIPTLLLSAAVP